MTLTPTFFINGERLRLDVDHYLAAGNGGGNRLELERGCSDAQCDGCGRNISETGYLEGNPTQLEEPGYDTCSVMCEECEQGYPVVWKEIR